MLGITGGTFDPIHMGHLIISEYIREQMGLEKIIFMPSKKPPHKKEEEVSSVEARWEMVNLAVVDNPWFEASDLEIKRPGMTYTIDTLKDLRNLYGGVKEIFFICGADSIENMLTWKQPEDIFSMCTIVAASRSGVQAEDFEKKISLLRKLYGARIVIANTPVMEISSTQIRERFSKGLSIRYMVPAAVEDYIKKKGLYKNYIF